MRALLMPYTWLVASGMAMLWSVSASADPCGMVPPITATSADAITRVGYQKTYVFYKNGIESFAIRPGYSGKVSQFGMLIPFPSPPAIRKIPDHLFSHIAAAVDPPEVSVYVRSPWRRYRRYSRSPATAQSSAIKRRSRPGGGARRDNWVKVLRQEAVGMYQVAVLEAGSPKALKAWMEQNKFRYPKGMDKPVGDYVKAGWCFVAVKTKVSGKQSIAPTPGMRKAAPSLPDNFKFDGHVQGMGFRFKTTKLVVPMRLSAYNKGKMRNIVYLLTDDPSQIKHLPSTYVVRQLQGKQLYANLTGPLPLRVRGMNHGESEALVTKELIKQHGKNKWLQARRDPGKHNGLARSLFASDLYSATTGQLLLDYEAIEKSFVNIGELLHLRGPDLDKLHRETLNTRIQQATATSLQSLKTMNFSVIDGDFLRDVLARENLSFKPYTMKSRHNSPRFYNARLARAQRNWTTRRLYHGKISAIRAAGLISRSSQDTWMERIGLFVGIGILAMLLWLMMRRVNQVASLVLWFGLGLGATGLGCPDAQAKDPAPAQATTQQETKKPIAKKPTTKKPGAKEATTDKAHAPTTKELKRWVAALGQPAKAGTARAALRKAGAAAIPYLWGAAIESPQLVRRGWALTTLAQIGGEAIRQKFQTLYRDTKQPALVRTWAAAAYLMRVDSPKKLDQSVAEMQRLGIRALSRPIGKQLLRLLQQPSQANNITEVLLGFASKPLYRKHVVSLLLKQPIEKLVNAMIQANDNNARRTAAGTLASFRSKSSQKQIIKALNRQLAFDPLSKEYPWKQGALFIPQFRWQQHKAAGRVMVGHLMAWLLWCDVQKDHGCQRQIHNNIRSWGLASALGYRPTWRQRGAEAWLRVYKKMAGASKVRALFAQQKLDGDPTYQAMMKRLGL